MTAAVRPICLQLAALGGQGGGVLADWLGQAAHLAGYPAQATSTPGVAQRTGATTYYFELFPDRNPPAAPVFSLFPDAGDVDLMIALEPLEAARALERGLITDQTMVITTSHRLYATSEKIIAGDGGVPARDLLAGLSAAAGKLVVLDPAALGSGGGLFNAAMLGAIAGSGVLPLTIDDYRAAITESGKAVDGNLAAFEAGLAAFAAPPVETPAKIEYAPPPPGFEDALKTVDNNLRPLIGHALDRLVDYQDRAYAELFLQRLRSVVDPGDPEAVELTAAVTRRLAAWMSYEDVIRVAQLKTRPGRQARIRGELGLADDAPFRLTDYLKPGVEEVAAMLPPKLARFVLARAKAAGKGRPLRIRTSAPWGFAAFRLLALLKPWRRHTWGYVCEQAAIERWLDAVRLTVPVDMHLASRVAELAVWARGYGDVRGRGLKRLEAYFADWPARLKNDRKHLIVEIEVTLKAARDNPDGRLG